MIPDLNIQATVTRILTLEDGTFTIDDGVYGSHMVSLMPPTRRLANDGSPRDGDPYTIRWRGGSLGPLVPPFAGWRLTLSRPVGRTYENLSYELLTDPSEVRVGPFTDGMQAPALPVSDLYPYEGELKSQGGTTIQVINVALWSVREDHQDTGTYENFNGEAPVEFATMLGDNKRIDIGGQRYRITSSIVDFKGPRVKFEARRSNG